MTSCGRPQRDGAGKGRSAERGQGGHLARRTLAVLRIVAGVDQPPAMTLR